MRGWDTCEARVWNSASEGQHGWSLVQRQVWFTAFEDALTTIKASVANREVRRRNIWWVYSDRDIRDNSGENTETENTLALYKWCTREQNLSHLERGLYSERHIDWDVPKQNAHQPNLEGGGALGR
jgi:hypothetical protein